MAAQSSGGCIAHERRGPQARPTSETDSIDIAAGFRHSGWMRSVVSLLGCASLLSFGCGSESVALTDEPAGANCPDGGVRVETASGGVQYVCDGAAGIDVSVTAVDPGAMCADGGVSIDAGSGATVVCSAGDAGAITITPIDPGAECAGGGVRIDSDGGGGTVCYGSFVSPEPPGTNCLGGGLRVEDADGTSSYLCDAPPSFAGLCPVGSTASAAELGIFARFTGDGGPLEGSASTPATPLEEPTPGFVEVATSCHGFRSPRDPASGLPTGRSVHEPFVLIMPLDRVAPLLYEEMFATELLGVEVRYYARDAAGGAAIDHVVDLDGAMAARIEQLSAPDPAQPTVQRAYLKVAFTYTSYEYRTPDDTVSATDVGFSALEPVTACEPTIFGAPRAFARMSTQDLGAVPGDATHPDAIGEIEIDRFCHAISSALDPSTGLPSGRRLHSPLVLIKHEDEATVPILETFFTNDNIPTFALRLFRATPSGDEHYATISLVNASLGGVEQLAVEGEQLERVTLYYQRITFTWTDGPLLAEDPWETPIF
jgi:type VI secretion system secreted protein Hcp